MAEVDTAPPPEPLQQHEGNGGLNGIQDSSSASSVPRLTSDKPEESVERNVEEIESENDESGAAGSRADPKGAEESSQAEDEQSDHPEKVAPLAGRALPTADTSDTVNGSPQPSENQVTSQTDGRDEQRALPDNRTSELHTRPRSDTRSTTTTQTTQRSTPVSSTVFVVTALDTIASSREARRSKELDEAVSRALDNIKHSDQQGIDPEVIFRPLQLAAKTFSVPLQVTALDCIGKLITYSYFAFPSAYSGADAERGKSAQPPLIERAIETICDCFENEATPVEIQQQIIKSLLAAVLNDKIVVHGAGLLKAVRQIYNIFIYSKSSQNQHVAQGSLTQMVGTVFERVRVRLDLKEARLRGTPGNKSEEELSGEGTAADLIDANGSGENDDSSEVQSTIGYDQPAPKEHQEKMTLQSFENNKNLDDAVVTDNAPTTVTRAKPTRKPPRTASGHQSRASMSMHEDHEEVDAALEEEEDDVYIRDAFLVFRSLCKLSQKVLTHDQQQDIKSQNMRSKLLSLHLIHHLMNNHMMVFTSPLSTMKSSNSSDPAAFLQVAKPHLCLSLSRNASSSVPRVFEVCCEIFWLALKHMRVILKKELEVFLKEVYLAILEKPTSPVFQKQYFMEVLERLSNDPRALVEIYLNYDCDRTALDNMYQRIIEQLSRFSSTPVAVTAVQQQQYQEHHLRLVSPAEWHQKGTLPPSLSTATIGSQKSQPQNVPVDYVLKQQALECLVDILRSLDNWSSQNASEAPGVSRYLGSRASVENSRESLDVDARSFAPSPRPSNVEIPTGQSTPVLEDDPGQIEQERREKEALSNAIRQFNFKPKRGIKALLAEGIVKEDTPESIAAFLLRHDRLDKAMIGEFLGEGEEYNVAIMHAFVDSMNFTKRRFVDALRQFLQSFRLPGEAQKIDRFMLKFAERYLTGNPNAFANADTAYVLAYSVILLNTDQHSQKMKGPRMTREDFIKNNRGINDGQDLPEDYLTGIFEEIASHEIVLDTERERAAALGIATQAAPIGLASRAGHALATVGRDLQKEKYAQASEAMANKTEQLYKSLIRAQKRSAIKDALSKFIPATSVRHVGPMFDVTWMSFLSGLSGQIQDTQNLELIRLCLEGIKLAIRIACRFDLETPRVAFVTALAKFTNLGNLREMAAKNVEALKTLLDVALTEGNVLRGSWRELLTCISQLDRFQLLSEGVDEGAIPDVAKAHIVPPPTADGQRSRKSMQGAVRRPRPRSQNSAINYRPDIALESRSTDVVRSVDRIFTNTEFLDSTAIIDFIKALSEVSWQEIQSSGQSDSPRTYSLQKLVEISSYNMRRVRIEWTKIWEVLGEHFNEVGCHTNTVVVFFALDSLRQLSKGFMDIEELPGFKFQKDFLKPFEHVMANSNVVTVKDMVLRCLIQLIQAKGENIRSGWKTIFGVFTVAAREPYEAIVNLAFDHVTQIYNTRFGVVISQGAFADLIVCLTEFSKNLRFQKKSLQAIETLKSAVPRMLKTPECPLSWRHTPEAEAQANGITGLSKQPNPQSLEEQFWYPILIAYQDVLMTGDDLEVRSRALNYLFETLVKYGGDFPPDFWDVLWRQLLYPIFVVLQSKSEMAKAPNHEELSVWLSTTMIQALRNMITLFTHYFDSLEHMLDRFLDLLTLCICQENDTIARIGSNCLQQLILQNVVKFRHEHWTKIVGAFVQLFNRTTAYELFSAAATMSSSKVSETTSASIGEASTTTDLTISTPETAETPAEIAGPAGLQINGVKSHDADKSAADESKVTSHSSTPPPQSASSELEDYRPHNDMQVQPIIVTQARRRFFNKIITNCVLQLLMIETVNELFSNDAVYAQIPSGELLRLMTLLKKSYQFAKKFNGDKDLRMALWRQGFMKQPPNLLKQESGSAATYVSILVRMYHDDGEERKANRPDTEAALIPLCADIIRGYIQLDEETQQRNIIAWRPVVVDVMEGYTHFPQESFDKHIETFYPLAVELLNRDLGMEVRLALQGLLRRIGEVRMGMAPYQTPLQTPTSPASSFNWTGGRRTSRGR